MEDLVAFDPHVAGTPPLGVDTDKSDIDILCQSDNLDYLSETLWKLYSGETAFRMWQWASTGRPVIAGFTAYGWDFEIFGSTEPVESQPGWRHFVVEDRLLSLGGEAFKAKVMEFRNAGFKTEPAFWSALKQCGDAYSRLLPLFHESDAALATLLFNAGFTFQA